VIPNDNKLVLNAEGLVLGRMASKVAGLLLEGKEIHIVNAEKCVVSGRRASLTHQWKESLKIKAMANPKYGPFHLRVPDEIISQTVKGMLPTGKARGRSSMKRLRVYIGLPEGLRDSTLETIPEARMNELRGDYIDLGDLAAEIGWNRKGG